MRARSPQAADGPVRYTGHQQPAKRLPGARLTSARSPARRAPATVRDCCRAHGRWDQRVGTAPAVDADPCTCGSPTAQHERRPSWSRTTTVPGTTRNHPRLRTPRPAQPRRGVRRLRAASGLLGGPSRRAGRCLGGVRRVRRMRGVSGARGAAAGGLGRPATGLRPGARVGTNGGGRGGGRPGGRPGPAAPAGPAPRTAGCRPGGRLDQDEVRRRRGTVVRRRRAVALLRAAHDEDRDQRGSAGGRRHRERGSETHRSAVPGAAQVGPPGRSGRDGRPL